MEDDRWPVDWLRAGLPLLVLAALSRGEAHGYALLQRLRDSGLTDIRGSTVYPLLTRQQQLGRLGSRWEHASAGPAKKVFFLTDEGRVELARIGREWRRFARLVESATADPAEQEQT